MYVRKQMNIYFICARVAAFVLFRECSRELSRITYEISIRLKIFVTTLPFNFLIGTS